MNFSRKRNSDKGETSVRRTTKASSAGTVRRPFARLAVAILGSGLLVVVALLGVGGTAATPTAAAAGCPNEAVRAEQGEAGLALPECRAYEMVSPVTSSPVPEEGGNASSLSGDRVAYRSWNPYTGQERESLRYVAERQADGWTIHNPIPGQNGAKTSSYFACNASFAQTPEIDHLVLVNGFHDVTTGNPEEELPVEGEECLGDEPPLDPGEPRGVANLFRTDPAGSSYELMNRPPDGVEAKNGELAGYSRDASVVVFTERAQLTPDAPAPEYAEDGELLYASRNGAIRYVPHLPDGTPVHAYLANAGTYGPGNRQNIANVTHAISDDGERIFFDYESKIYLREHALREQSATNGEECTEPDKACTIPIDVSAEGPAETSIFGQRSRFDRAFLYATPDGSRVFFMDDRKLTPDANTALPVKNAFGELINAKSDLYEYDVASGETTDLTPNAGGEPASVRGFVGAAEDASYVYFAAFGDLTGAQQNSEGDTAQAGHNNLYVLHEGSITYITTLMGGEAEASGGESQIWQEIGVPAPATESARTKNTGNMAARFSLNGRFLAFPSAASLTGFDNSPAEPDDCTWVEPGTLPGAGCLEWFVYDAEAQQLECASCSPAGDAPSSAILARGPSTTVEPGNGQSPAFLPHVVSNSGTMFFDTENPLVPADGNGELDVYAYEDGAPQLISTGSAVGPSKFVDASADGSNVFFNTGQGLVGRDTDNSNSLYDARVNGGFLEPPPLPGCQSEACRGQATGPATTAGAGSANFSGPGNRKPVHTKDCGLYSKRASKFSKQAKTARRQAGKASGKRAAKLKRKAGTLAAKSHKLSKQAKTCRNDNGRAGK